MIRWLSRFLGLWLVAGGLVALVIDATRSIAASQVIVSPLASAFDAILGPAALVSAQAFVRQEAGEWLWDTAIQSVLALPTWAVLGALGFLFTFLGRRKRLRPTYA